MDKRADQRVAVPEKQARAEIGPRPTAQRMLKNERAMKNERAIAAPSLVILGK